MEVYARELIPALLSAAPSGMRFTAFLSREARQAPGDWQELLPSVVLPINASSRAQWVLGEQTLLPWQAARVRIDIMHSLGSTAPFRGRFRRVVTIHDLIYARFPEAHGGLRAMGMRVLVPLAARRSNRVIADSESTRSDLIELLGLPRERIDVVPLGLGRVRRAQPAPKQEVRARFDLGDQPVLLSLSAKRPHKNLLALIDALSLVPAERRPLVVMPGYATWHERELAGRARERGVGENVRLLPWLPDGDLESLWAVSSGFVFPSLYEGFGLPVLEAMARGVPVACSDASSLPEVAGEAAILFDPHDMQAIASAIERLLDPAEAIRLSAMGLERARQFTWERTARATLQTYERALGPVRA